MNITVAEFIDLKERTVFAGQLRLHALRLHRVLRSALASAASCDIFADDTSRRFVLVSS